MAAAAVIIAVKMSAKTAKLAKYQRGENGIGAIIIISAYQRRKPASSAIS
jgi:hypothetical protein